MAALKPGANRLKPPRFGLVIEVPAPFFNESRLLKIHKDSAKSAIQEALMDYWRSAFPDHFRQDARGKYRYADRSKPYKKKKKEETRSITDLVRTGKTRVKMTTQRPTFSMSTASVAGVARGMTGKGIHGTNARFGMTGVLTLGFPFPASSVATKQRVDGKPAIVPAVMADELSRWSSDASVKATYIYRDHYRRSLFQAIANSPRWRKKYSKDLNSLYP